MLVQLEIRAGIKPLPNKGRILSFPSHYTAVWTWGQSFVQCHIKLTATNIMGLNEPPVDGGDTAGSFLLTGKMPWTGETCVISAHYKAGCNLKAVKSHKKSCFEMFFHEPLLLAATTWNSPHLFPGAQVPNLRRDRGAKCKRKSCWGPTQFTSGWAPSSVK